MFVRDLGALLWRRWYLSVAAILLASGIAAAAYQSIPSTYQATASVVLLPPTTPETTGENRFLGLGDLTQAVDVVIRSVTANDTQDQLEGDKPEATFEVTPDYTSNAPIMVVTAKGRRDATERLLQRVVAAIPRELTRIQASVATPEAYRISALTVTRDKTPEVLLRPKLRFVVVLFVVALVAGSLLVAAMDGLLLRRARQANRTSSLREDTNHDPRTAPDVDTHQARAGPATARSRTTPPKRAVVNRRAVKSGTTSPRRRGGRGPGEARSGG